MNTLNIYNDRVKIIERESELFVDETKKIQQDDGIGRLELLIFLIIIY